MRGPLVRKRRTGRWGWSGKAVAERRPKEPRTWGVAAPALSQLACFRSRHPHFQPPLPSPALILLPLSRPGRLGRRGGLYVSARAAAPCCAGSTVASRSAHRDTQNGCILSLSHSALSLSLSLSHSLSLSLSLSQFLSLSFSFHLFLSLSLSFSLSISCSLLSGLFRLCPTNLPQPSLASPASPMLLPCRVRGPQTSHDGCNGVPPSLCRRRLLLLLPGGALASVLVAAAAPRCRRAAGPDCRPACCC